MRHFTPPHLLDLEIAQVLRRYARTGELDPELGLPALDDLADVPLFRYPHDLFLRRIWELRAAVTAYDAAYLAPAEVLDALMVAGDRRLVAAPGHRALG